MEFHKHINLELIGLDKDELHELIGKNPRIMQLVFRKTMIVQSEIQQLQLGSFPEHIFKLVHSLNSLKMNNETIEGKAWNSLQKAMQDYSAANHTKGNKEFANGFVNLMDTHTFKHNGKSFNALKVASHNSSVKQVLLNILACVATLGYGLVEGLKSYHERGQFDTGIDLFKSKSTTRLITDMISKINESNEQDRDIPKL